ncbi:MAG TPA: T9SS type A sorting domain-containing protein [Flavobacterium sp.]|uniref:T9SS type A sorting domain-containing protein n=1 Tax=Flavobacterium sp. TaxID=239 RepID=UPI002C8795E8|nr:T9SS type A sorting domain-containing protein [Flavobacterium sp.]HSD14464.1 T9SS type A sorting domain-containing protein [Flavobacterium sp.]
MKKITLSMLVFMFGLVGFSQTYSTGTVQFFTNYSGKVDVTSSTVTLTLIGPSGSWLGVGFNAPNLMNDFGKDVVIFDGTNMTDRSFDGLGVEPPTDTQNWTVTSNVINAGVRTVTATRSRVAAEGTDFTFPFSAQPLQLTYARGTSLTVTYHGSGNCGATNANLGVDGFDLNSFKVYPNPAADFVKIELPNLVYEADIVVYDIQGKKVKQSKVTSDNNTMDLSGLTNGSYLLNIKTANGQGVKTLVIN